MSFDRQTLFDLLPAIHRIRDAERAATAGLQRGPLEELLALLSEQIGVAEEHLDQLHDDLFIETCAEWVVPYIGDLIGYRSLHQVGPAVVSARAEVAHAIALRRRKGTALVLEQLARDVTQWDARAVEYFQRLCTTQYMNHLRPQNLQSPDLRRGGPLEWIDTPFETANRTVDVRRIASRRGRHNITNVGLHLWRIQAHAHRESPAFRTAARRYRASPLNHDLALYNRPRAEDDITHLAEPDNVPWPLSRRRLSEHLARHYGERASIGASLDNPEPGLLLWIDGTLIERDQIRICHLGDDGPTWAHSPPPDGLIAIDPVLGRIALSADAPDPADVLLTWREGLCANIGGGEYERGITLPVPPNAPVQVPGEHPTLGAALAAIAGNGVIEITDSSRYTETLAIEVQAQGRVEIRASNGRRPVLDLTGLTISGGENSACILNGLLLTGAPLEVPDGAGNVLARLQLAHCTLVPGIGLQPDASPTQPGIPSLHLSVAGLETDLTHCIIGGIRCHDHASVRATDSLIDATARDAVAFAAPDHVGPGGMLSLIACTVVGKVNANAFGLVSNSILHAALAEADTWTVAVRTMRKQVGCVRFSWLPIESVVPARHRCQPTSQGDAQRIAPRFTSLRYGTPAYGQLTTATPAEIRLGADDESEMGVYHHLLGAQRETNLGIRLAEYLRVGLQAGIFYAS